MNNFTKITITTAALIAKGIWEKGECFTHKKIFTSGSKQKYFPKMVLLDKGFKLKRALAAQPSPAPVWRNQQRARLTLRSQMAGVVLPAVFPTLLCLACSAAFAQLASVPRGWHWHHTTSSSQGFGLCLAASMAPAQVGFGMEKGTSDGRDGAGTSWSQNLLSREIQARWQIFSYSCVLAQNCLKSI